jgi:hypothetical protein
MYCDREIFFFSPTITIMASWYLVLPNQDLSLLTKRFKNVCIFENRRRNKNTQVEQELLTLPEHLSSTPLL